MAYMNVVKKKMIKEELDKVVPKNWKYSLTVHNYSTISFSLMKSPSFNILTLKEGVEPIHQTKSDLIETPLKTGDYININEYYIKSFFPENSTEAKIFQDIFDALDTNNHNNSDSQSDYFDVGHYVSMSIGKYNKPYTVIQEKAVDEMGKDFYELENFIGSNDEKLSIIGDLKADLNRYIIKLDRDEDCIVISEDNVLHMTMPIDEAQLIVNEVNNIKRRIAFAEVK